MCGLEDLRIYSHVTIVLYSTNVCEIYDSHVIVVQEIMKFSVHTKLCIVDEYVEHIVLVCWHELDILHAIKVFQPGLYGIFGHSMALFRAFGF